MVISIKKYKRAQFSYPLGKPDDSRSYRYQGIAVDDYSFTLDASALKPSGFCNDRVIFFGSMCFYILFLNGIDIFLKNQRKV